jgi:hypothetical protein
MVVRTTCLKCGTPQLINFGSLPLAEAIKALDAFDQPGECPRGFHIELSGWSVLWQFGSALVLVYGDEAAHHPRVKHWIEHERSYRAERKLEHRAAPELRADEVAA